MFDDYPDRPNYHVIEQIIKPSRIVDNRMAIFQVEPGDVTGEFLLHHLDAFYRPYH